MSVPHIGVHVPDKPDKGGYGDFQTITTRPGAYTITLGYFRQNRAMEILSLPD